MTLGDFPVYRPNSSAGRSDDFLAFHPVPRGPDPEAPPPDPVADEFMGTKVYAKETPYGGRGGSMTLVDRSVCRYPCEIPGHIHNEPEFRPQPDLDESHVGWTVQHLPTDFAASQVISYCVLCWSAVEGHTCRVLEVVNG